MLIQDFHKQTTLPDLQGGETRSFPLPRKIGPYKIESLLNKGGMSLLYLATHPGNAKPIVIKILLPEYLKNKEIANRFLKEAQIIGMSNHPNIVKLYGQGQWEKGLYIAMEFIRGISLRQFIEQKSLSQKRALEIILQVAYALCHLHTHGVIHRDLKPENILITETGEIKVIDFGISQLEGEPLEEPSPRMMGTPVYMSPEQKEHPQQATYSSDIFSLGIIAYELILGRLSHGVIELSLLPKTIRPIIETALKIDPKERYLDIVDFITRISQSILALEEEKEEREGEFPAEMLEMIHYTHSLLLPKKGPRWPPLEIGVGIHQRTSLRGLYLDFFRLPENRFCIVLAEPIEQTLSSLTDTSVFRGMVRMAIEEFFPKEKKNQHPIQMLNALSHALSDDPMKREFALSLLVLTPDKDLLSFASCGYSDLWLLAEGSSEIRILTTPNGPLGGGRSNVSLLETSHNWNSGDLLILHSLRATAAPPLLAPLIRLPPQPQSEKLLQQLSPTHTAALLSLHRLF